MNSENEYPVFPNAPIREAVLDIRVDLPNDINSETLESFYERIKEKYPEKKQVTTITTDFSFLKDKIDNKLVSNKLNGYFYRSNQENKVIQTKLDGFTFSKLQPYENWDKFVTEAKAFYEQYTKIVKPIRITRIALRYINQINLPLPFSDFKEYILTIPEVAPGLPQALSGFFMQLTIPNPDDANIFAIINQTMKPPTKDNKLPFIFDIDVIKLVNYNDGDLAIWEQFQKLRYFKDDIFLKSITGKTKEMFK